MDREKMENVIGIRGISRDDEVALIALTHLPNRPGIAYHVFGLLAEEEIDVDIILQSIIERSKSQSHGNEIIFTIRADDVPLTEQVLQKNLHALGARQYLIDMDVTKISVSGVGMKGTPGIAAKVFRALYESGIEIMHISTSEIKISLLLRKQYAEKAIQSLYENFNLEL